MRFKFKPPVQQPRYCKRELPNGTACSHHLIVHPGGGPCTGMDPYGNPCGCIHFLETATSESA